MFVSTKNTYSENRKARIKNHNLPIIQHMYMGSPTEPLRCIVDGSSAFKTRICRQRKIAVNYFRIDFNHIRQRAASTRQSGTSVDKGKYSPSGIFRGRCLDREKYQADLVEFMTIMPVCTEQHTIISQESAYGDITLSTFDTNEWTWVLQNPQNFNEFVTTWKLDTIVNFTYDKFIDHLSDIRYPNVRERLVKENPDSNILTFV